MKLNILIMLHSILSELISRLEKNCHWNENVLNFEIHEFVIPFLVQLFYSGSFFSTVSFFF